MFPNLTELIKFITRFVGSTIPIAVGLCLLIFLWGVFQVFGDAEDASKRKEGYTKIFWGLIALFVVVSLGGIVQILSNTLLHG